MQGLREKLIETRRDFHKYAESMWKEYRTTSIVAKHLIALGIPITMGADLSVKGMQFQYPDKETIENEKQRAILQGADPELIEKMCDLPGVMGTIDTGREGPVTAFRFDMDALPFSETLNEDHKPVRENYVSINDGSCHACGHDGHTAVGMVVAEELMKIKDQLCGKIKLIFQPSEEGGGGARGIVEKGCLDDVQYLFVGHVGLTKLDGLPLKSHGIIGGAKDFLDSRRYNIIYKGKAAHPCGNPNDGKNALLASCVAALGIHTIPPHSQGEFHQNVGVMHAGSSRNTIAADSYMEVEVRGENDIVAEYGERKMLAVVKGAAEAYEVGYDVVLIGKSASGASDDAAIDIVIKCAKTLPWFTEFHSVGSVGGSDDASEMLRRVQKNGGVGTYIGLGTNFTTSFHDKAFDFDEDVLEPSAELFVKIVEEVQSNN